MKREQLPDKKFSYLNFLRQTAWLLNSRDKKHFLAILVFMIFGAFLEFLGIGLIPIFINALMGSTDVFTIPIINLTLTHQSAFWVLSTSIMATFVLKCVFFRTYYKFQTRFVTSIRRRLASKLFSIYLRDVPWTFYHKRHTSEMYRNIMRETTELMLGALMPMLSVLLGLLVIIPLIILTIITLPIECSLAYFCFGAFTAFLFNQHKKILSHSGNTSQLEHKLTTKKINEGLYTFSEARILDKTDFLFNRFHNSLSNYLNADRIRLLKTLVFPHYLEALALIGLMMVLCIYYLKDQSFTSVIPQIGLLSIVTVRLRQNATKIFIGLGQIQFSKYSVDHIYKDLKEFSNDSNEVEEKGKETEGDKEFKNTLQLDDVSYTYHGCNKPVISGISLLIKSNESAAFVGSTGSGKSTLLYLVLGFLKPDQGSIKFDGNNIYKNLKNWRKNIGYVPQSINLIDDTILANIAFGIHKDKVDHDSLQNAIKIAQLDDVISDLDNGLETVVGEAGNKLSGGQKQRVVIARALYRNPNLLIMDEATSALDSTTEANLYRDLKLYRPNLSSIIITHRLATIKNCNQIFFIDNGKLIGSGTHESLLENVPMYQKLQIQ